MATKAIRLHIICGFCGSNDMMTFSRKEPDEDDPDPVTFHCGNCAVCTSIGEVLEERK